MERALPAARRCAFYPYVLHPPARASGEVGPARRWVTRLRAGEVTPFSRLAIVHGLSSAGDAMVAIALAGSIFFNVSVKAAQSRVALSLALTVAPFAIVGPLLGPVVERVRGGRRAIVLGSGAGRAACAFFMAMWAKSLLIFPVAFFTLVFSKLYLVAKAALVPSAVERHEDLVLANSKLSVGGSVAGMVAGGVGVGLFNLFGARFLLRFDIAVYLLCAWGATRLRSWRPSMSAKPAARRPSEGQLEADVALAVRPLEPGTAPADDGRPPALGLPPAPSAVRRPVLGLPPGGIQLAALSTAGLRAVTGFVTFLLVFTFRREGAALVWYGLALGASQVGNVSGALLAPKLRRRAPEEWMLTGASAGVGAASLCAGLVHWGTHWAVAVLLAGGIGLAAGAGKLAFDSMVQRDVPTRVRGRSFARFESGFQLAWAVGGLLAVLVPMSLPVGFVVIGAVGLCGSVAFAGGSVKARRGTLPSWWPGSAPRPSKQPAHR